MNTINSLIKWLYYRLKRRRRSMSMQSVGIASPSKEAPASAVEEAGIRPYYERRKPSDQTVADIFRGSWKSQLPGGLHTGEARMFEDTRPAWVNSLLPNGFHWKSVLELGPFEAYQTYLMVKEGARDITSVEANSVNFLKCLCIKEMYGLTSVRLCFGDVVKFAHECNRSFDVVWASGVLYHLQDPVGFIDQISRLGTYVYLWTHYFDFEVMENLRNGQERHFLPELNKKVEYRGRSITLNARSYLIPEYDSQIPFYWEGGLEQITYWLSKDDIVWLFEQRGMRVVSIQSDDTNTNELPAISLLLATRG